MKATGDGAGLGAGVVWTFSGQGSYSYRVLRDLYTRYPDTWPYFRQADGVSRRFLGCSFLPLVIAASQEEHDERLKVCPDLDQIGIYLTSVLTAHLLMRSRPAPDLLVGHSFGELAAMAVAGVYGVETGLRIVCQRVIALQALAVPGRMAALSCDYDTAKNSIHAVGDCPLEISVLNHPRQTVVSGPAPDLKRLGELLARKGVSLTVLKSRYPFHSSFLERVVKQFAACLGSYDFRPARIPVYLSMEGMLYSPGCDLAQVLSSQLTQPLDFSRVVATLYDSGYRHFIECGGGDIVTRLVAQNLAGKAGVTALATANVATGLSPLLEQAPPTAAPPWTPLEDTTALPVSTLDVLPALLDSVSRLVQHTSLLLDSRSGLPQASTAVSPAPADHAAAQRAADPAAAPDSHLLEREPQQESAPAGEQLLETPVAIVSMGCVLPGAHDPEEYWNNVLNGVSGVSNLADLDPSAARDFLAGDGKGQVTIVPDKTYTLLHGSIPGVPYDADLLAEAFDEAQFGALTKGQKLLAIATAQSLKRLKNPLRLDGGGRIQCILGSTADGSKEHDEALFVERVESVVATLDEPEDLRRRLAAAVEEIAEYKTGDSRTSTQHTACSEVLAKVMRRPIRTYLVDAACSSSLYSICLGMKALQDGESDAVLAGGVFAPGPANNALFAQFRGLTPRESRPFDAAADGVVFGDGAGMVVLKRLPDALADGDRILAVIRGVGLSSDGKSPSINVPRSGGQSVAIRRAYERAAVDIGTIQYVEAHATATPVGDAVEFKALTEAFGREPASAPIQLGSVKALVGHTGWAAGVASVIKLCKAFEARVIPKQYNYDAPDGEIDLSRSPFAIARSSSPWPPNVNGYPRRAGINGFGFGGTNAHLILESFDAAYHEALCRRSRFEKPREGAMALVGLATLFPDEAKPATDSPSSVPRFTRRALRLPAGKMLLPDVTDHMDASQYLAGLAAEKALSSLPGAWTRLKPVTGIVLGLESKTERGVGAIERIFLDRLKRRLEERSWRGRHSQADADRIVSKLAQRMLTRNLPSGPYTLPGLMPNVAAGRIASLFDLNGPNIVIDMGRESVLQSLWVARQLLLHGDCELALAGGISANRHDDEADPEAALLMALTTLETARRESWPVLATLTAAESQGREASAAATNGAAIGREGGGSVREIAAAIHDACTRQSPYRVTARLADGLPVRTLALAPTVTAAAAPAPQPAPPASASGTYAYVQGTPITCYTPCRVPSKAAAAAKPLKGRRIGFLTDQPEYWAALEASGALAGLDYTVISTAGARLRNVLPVDLSTDEAVRSSLSAGSAPLDTLIAVRSLERRTESTLLSASVETELAWIDLLFAVCRHNYERIQDASLSVVTVCLDALTNGQLDPYTGLVSGFMKSLAREQPHAVCRIINTDTVDFREALRLVEIELGQSGAAEEVCYCGAERSVVRLAPVPELARDDRPYLDSESVVVATGGGRGVTAILAEQLLEEFGCRVIALGRTDPSAVPDAIRNMDDQALQRYEPEFYKDALRRDKSSRITDLKRQYLGYRAANEVHRVTRELQGLGKYEYRCVDITDERATDACIESIFNRFGRVDLVLHGAGVQISKVLAKKSLSDFRRIVATKVGGLSGLYKACEKRRQGRPVHYHILTSAFSYLGNDGQCDYGAANEAMNRIAASMDAASTDAHWSSMAWLGWAGIGMTRDSEFAALAASRRLRGVTKEEGKRLFSALLKGTPATPINILLAAGEVDYYGVRIEAAAHDAPARAPAVLRPRADSLVLEQTVSVESAPYVLNHLVNGTPTLPGALIIAMVGQAARQLRPDLKIVSFEQAHFHRFIRVYPNRGTPFRVLAEVVSEEGDETVAKVRLVSDFVHRSGKTLQKDILQHEILVRMAPSLGCPTERVGSGTPEGRPLRDPYVMEGSPVCLSGPFRTMTNITAGRALRTADYRLDGFGHPAREGDSDFPMIALMDSLWRFGAIDMAADGSLPVYVPEQCDLMRVYFDFAEADARRLAGPLTLSGANPRDDGERLRIGPIAASDSAGNVLLVVEGGVCRRLGEVKSGFELQAVPA